MNKMMGFLKGVPIYMEKPEEISRTALLKLFSPNGPLQMVVVNGVRPFKGFIIALCKIILINCVPISPTKFWALRV